MPTLQALPDEVPSPCVGICQLDAEKVCTGCGRSIVEIAEWSRAGNARKHEIIGNAEVRMQQAPLIASESAND